MVDFEVMQFKYFPPPPPPQKKVLRGVDRQIQSPPEPPSSCMYKTKLSHYIILQMTCTLL